MQLAPACAATIRSSRPAVLRDLKGEALEELCRALHHGIDPDDLRRFADLVLALDARLEQLDDHTPATGRRRATAAMRAAESRPKLQPPRRGR